LFKILLLSLALFVQAPSLGQNLVPNPSFEEFYKCPGSYNYSSDGKLAPGWFSPTAGTPDLYNQCSRGDAGVPTNWAGQSKPYSGKGYAGIYCYVKGKNYREYLQTKLTEPLRPGFEYYVEYLFRLSSNSKYSIDRIGFLLSDSANWQVNDDPLGKATYEYRMASAYTRSTGVWNKCRFFYKAKGGEQYLTLGNFSDDNATRSYHIKISKAKEPMLENGAYYYIDDVRVTYADPQQKPEKPLIVEGYPEVKLNERYVLKNIYFEFDSARLVGNSFSELDKWLVVINAKKNWKIELTGHTDERGSEQYNLDLSLARVESVANYLISKSVDPMRFKLIGEGKRRPLSVGKDEAAHALNRRVEIRFLEK
jgi:outer membrane protein OmpA-like peptidoglycan-associated protein